MAEITLRCWVWGEDPPCPFEVKINSVEYVDGLTKAIKKQCPSSSPTRSLNLNVFPDYHISLFKVSFTEDEIKKKFYNEAQKLELIGGPPLSPMKRLSAVFTEPLMDDHIHVIVVRPTGTHDCFQLLTLKKC